MDEQRIKELEELLDPTDIDAKRKAANELISIKLQAAEELLRTCEQLGKDYNVNFSWDLAYGMGGNFDGGRGAWQASSDNC